MKTLRITMVALCFPFLVFTTCRVTAATVTWDGGGGDLSWQNAANWSGNALPGSADDVVINVTGDVAIRSGASVTIRGLQCSNSLTVAGGIFRVTGGPSVVQGRLSATNSVTVSATGAGTTFTVAGAANVNGASFEATGGARVLLPGLAAYAKGSTCNATPWRASGAGSVLEFPGLTSIAGGSCAALDVQALSGGTVSLANATTLHEGLTTFQATGTNSLVDLGALVTNLASARIVSFEARNGGVVSMPRFAGGRSARVTVESGGAVPLTQLRELNGFTVSGAAVDFPALTNVTTGNVTVRGGAVVAAPNLAIHDHGAACEADTWEVNGVGSLLNLSSLTSLTGPACGHLTLVATAGGTLVLSNLPAINDGEIYFRATGTNSLVDLGSLQESPGVTRALSFEARNGGTVSMPRFPGGPTVHATLEHGGVLPAAQFRRLSGFTVAGMAVNLAALTNLTTGNVTVRGGAVVAAPNLAIHDHGAACETDTWEVNGAGSLLDLSSLTSLTGPACGYLILAAMAGGTLVLSNLPAIDDGELYFRATDTNSLVDLGSLQESPGVTRALSFEARDGGTVSMPRFPGGPTVRATLEHGGVLPAAQFRRLSGFTVAGMAVNLAALTNLTPGNILVSDGAVVTAPNLASHVHGTLCFANTWEVRGAGSVLDLSALTSLRGSTCGYLTLNATAGGTLVLSNLPVIADGTLSFLADGTNSVVDLSALRQALATARTVALEARNSGSILMPLLEGGPTVTVAIKSGGQLSAAQMSLLRGLTVSGTTLELPLITNLFSGNLNVSSGAVLRLPNLFQHNHGTRCAASTWEVNGAGSVLDLSSLTNLTGVSCGDLLIQALAGGTANLSNLVTISEGSVSFLADGLSSLVNLAALQRSEAVTYPVSFEVRNAGTLAMPWMTGGPTVAVTICSNGVLSIAMMTRLRDLTVSAAAVDFPALTNFDGGSLVVTNGATVTAPRAATYAQGNGCGTDTWLVRDAGSVADFPGLTYLTGGTCAWLDAQALNGGRLLLGNLRQIPWGRVHFLASGNGSLIDLHSLSNFLNASSLSRLTATNGGSILLPSPSFFSGVTLALAAGTPGLPPTSLEGTNLILHGRPWQSYWVESRGTTLPDNPWTFLRAVPLTNGFQPIAPRAAANREFRAWEFVADPFLLELSRVGSNVQLVLYAPTNRVFDVQAAANLTPTVIWSTLAAVTMTNPFRIFPPEPLTMPERYFQAVSH